MKIFKRVLLTLAVIFGVTSFLGYLYFEKTFTPQENYLEVTGAAGIVPLKWATTENNPYSAVLLPIKIKGSDKQFYMQLDFGSPITMFYKNSLQSIQVEFPKQILLNDNSGDIMLDFNISEMHIYSNSFRLIDYGDKVDFENPNAENIIGTIGTDLLEKRVVELDFKNNSCSFSEITTGVGFVDFEFRKRKILIPAKIDNKDLVLMYDSGTSGYELITSKSEWEKYRTKNAELKTEEGNSWGNTLRVISSPADNHIQFGNKRLKLSEVTYIEGTSRIQNLLMMLSGMQGMIGNKIFLNHKIILDCKNERFKVE